MSMLNMRASPKSAILIFPLWVMRMFCGFRSRCTTRMQWRKSMPRSICAMMFCKNRALQRCWSRASMAVRYAPIFSKKYGMLVRLYGKRFLWRYGTLVRCLNVGPTRIVPCLEASHDLNSSKLGNTNVHESYFRIDMQLTLFWSAENENFGKNLRNFSNLRTVRLKYRTFRAYHPMKST